MSEIFGCCQDYEKCSDAMKCLHIGEPELEGCHYRKNLEAGKIFYGKNVGAKKVNKELYLYCFDRLFKITTRNKVGLSYNLKTEQIGELVLAFDSLKIPYKTVIEDDLCILEGMTEADPTPCNAKVYFEYQDSIFNIANYNSFLIKNHHAEMIAKALNAKGIKANYESFGKVFTYVRPETKLVKTEAKLEPITEIVTNEAKDKYIQINIMDLVG